MGGLLFNTKRLGLLDYLAYKREVNAILDFYGIERYIPMSYKSKKDFGDIDVIIKTTVKTEDLLKIFKDCDVHYEPKSETIISFNFKDFQLDFIKVKPVDFEISFYYFSYNDLGNLIGQLAKCRNLKFGMDGLRYNHYVKSQLKGSIPISKDIDKILRFIDLDPRKYHNKFDTIEDMFEFIIESKYFNPYVSDLEPFGFDSKGVALYRLNKMNRERNSKRKTYIEWLKYINKYKIGEENYLFRDNDMEKVYGEIEEFFPECHFRIRLKEIEKKESNRLRIKSKFDGNLIKKLIPELKKEDFQFFIDAFKSYITSTYTHFEDYIDSAKQEIINDDILKFYKSFKERYYE